MFRLAVALVGIFSFWKLSEAHGTPSGLVCYSCPGHAYCKSGINNWRRRCRINSPGGKCFIRTDPTGRQYWGCLEEGRFPGLHLERNGCWERRGYGWGGRTSTWCVCDQPKCNTNVTAIMTSYPKTSPPRRRTVIEATTKPQTTASVLAYDPEQGKMVPLNRLNDIDRNRISRYDNFRFVRPEGRQAGDEPTKTTELPSVTRKQNSLQDTSVRDCRFARGGCDHECVPGQNTWYGACRCRPGYYLGEDGASCLDTNECDESNGGCSDKCINTPGSFQCGCFDGYKRQGPDTCVEIDECDGGKGPCSHACQNLKGSYRCTCPRGYMLGDDQVTCQDINECRSGLAKCSQRCNNTLGSFHCYCREGYSVNADGWSCDDVDECAVDSKLCAQKCVNVEGSYRCSCHPGYRMSVDGVTCQDDNECLMSNGGCSQTCNNTLGGYRCECLPGYELNIDGHTCQVIPDARSCYIENGGCEHLCTMVDDVSVSCGCRRGFDLDSNKRNCKDINECLLSNHSCSQNCENNYGSYECSCRSGFVLDVDRQTCNDINECQTDNGGCAHTCENTEGSYHCDCIYGYAISDDKRSCQDFNECLDDNGGCLGTCLNTAGSFECACARGYKINADRKSCDDEDECADGSGGCSHHCVNTDGSFYCGCASGFQLDFDNRTCYDTNECQLDNGGCEQKCNNMMGMYMCSCHAGYTLNVDHKSCDDIDECLLGYDDCAEGCINTPGNYNCTCGEGYVMAADGHACDDEDECVVNKGGCEQNCINTEGSFQCDCGDLFALADDGRSCLAMCPAGFDKAPNFNSCLRIHSNTLPKSFEDAETHCQNLNTHAHLAAVDTTEKRLYLATRLRTINSLLDGWQGWWIGGRYLSGLAQFVWTYNLEHIPLQHTNWGIQRQPFKDTCLWLMQGSAYAYNFENHNCTEPSGFICEIILPS